MADLAGIMKERVEELAFTEKELEELERARNMPIPSHESTVSVVYRTGGGVEFRQFNTHI